MGVYSRQPRKKINQKALGKKLGGVPYVPPTRRLVVKRTAEDKELVCFHEE